MSDYDLVSGLVDASVYIIAMVVGVGLFFLGRKRGQRPGGAFLTLLGIVLFVLFAIPVGAAVGQAMSSDSQSASPSTTVAASPTISTWVPGTSAPTTAATTTTTVPSKYYVPDYPIRTIWAEDAIEYAESQDWVIDDKDAATSWLVRSFSYRTCTSLTQSSSDKLFQIAPQTPEQAEADARKSFTMERWEAYGEVWFDSLVNGLCIRP